jgi:chlorobactene glucosyltransferase
VNTILFERYLGAAYMLAGPFTWGVFLFGMIKGQKRMALLRRPIEPLPDPAPSATILVPIKDEAHQIRACLASVLSQDYPPGKLQIITINDRSTDATAQILDEIARDEPRLHVVHIKQNELPPGWVGKSHALHVGMKHATGDWLLFVDSDVALTPDALRATVALAEQKRFDLVSLLPKLINETFWERLIVPLGGAATSAMYMLPLTNYNEQPNVAFANGQFLCARRTAYEKIGGHEAVREKLSEDIAIAKAMKKIGLRPRLSVGADFASTRMYNSLSMVMRGWSRNFFCGSAGHMPKTIAAVFFVLLCGFSAYAAIAWGI